MAKYKVSKYEMSDEWVARLMKRDRIFVKELLEASDKMQDRVIEQLKKQPWARQSDLQNIVDNFAQDNMRRTLFSGKCELCYIKYINSLNCSAHGKFYCKDEKCKDQRLVELKPDFSINDLTGVIHYENCKQVDVKESWEKIKEKEGSKKLHEMLNNVM